MVRRALGVYNLDDGYMSMRTIYVFRERLTKRMGETGENLIERTFERATEEQLAQFRLKTGRQRVDSTQIASNIREMGRLQLLVEVLQRVHRMLSEEERASWGAEFAPYVKGTSYLGNGKKVSDGIAKLALHSRLHHLQLNHYP